MSTNEADKTIKSDDDWKEQVRAEAEQADAAASEPAEQPAVETPTADQPTRPQIQSHQLPPANLTTLVSMLGTQAMVALGALPDPSTGEAEPQPALARHFIDMLAMIEQKTKENLTVDEQRMLNSTLHELRMAFVQMTGK
ncbi:MAG: DUF1844 domain-containing protein [Planctomycetaceae bacterium]